MEAEFVFDLKELTKHIYEALKVEENQAISYTKIYLEGGKLKIRIRAKDLSELRASINSWLRLIKACLEVL